MVAILVARARAERLLGKQIESGRALGDTLAQQVNSEPGYRGWIHDKERWKSLSLEALRVIYGEESPEWKEFDQSGRIFVAIGGTPWQVDAKHALDRHASCLNVLQSLVERLEFAEVPSRLATDPEPEERPMPTGVFVVHGHNQLIREQVARTINEEGGRKAVILHEQTNRGQTLIEKFERHASEAGWAVILLTADDVGGTSEHDLHPRARQNVVLEMGFFYGRLGRDHVVTAEQGERAQSLLEGLEAPVKKPRSPTKPLPRPVIDLIPIKQGKVEAYDTKTKNEVIRARREENKLVADFAAHLTRQGDSVCRHKITVPEAGGPLYSDLYNETRRQLIEAKAGNSRGEVRMAIGQLADYARLIDPTPRRAILLEARPLQDLIDLLHGQHIAVIWRDGDGFTDNANQLFT